MRALALDVGDARIGLAISDPNGVVCLPIEALVRSEESADLAAVNIEGSNHFNVSGAPVADSGMHETSELAGLSASVVLEPLDQGAGAVTDAGNCDLDFLHG